MHQYTQLKTKNIWATMISFILTVIFSFLQVTHSNAAIYSIINNIAICILTGCAISLIQILIGLKNEKNKCVYNFYKSITAFESMVSNLQFIVGFIEAQTLYEKLTEIADFFEANVKLDYRNINVAENQDKEISAVKDLMLYYYPQYEKIITAKKSCIDAIKLMQKDFAANRYSINSIPDKDFDTANNEIQYSMENVLKEFNNNEKYRKIRKNYNILEVYLFGEALTKVSRNDTENRKEAKKNEI